MKIYKPDFYDRFHCIAGDCDFTCCQQWKIAVDDATNKAWKDMAPPLGMKTRKKNMSLFTRFKDGTRVIGLDQDKKCPFLNDCRLCRIVVQYGEQAISETCQTFPREKHEFADHMEHSLVACCPEVIDLLNESKKFQIVTSEKEESCNADENAGAQEAVDTQKIAKARENTEVQEIPEGRDFQIRSFFMDLIQNPELTLEEGLLTIFFLALQFRQKETLSIQEVKEGLPEVLAAIRQLKVDGEEHARECNELFLDLTCNYCKEGLYQKHLQMPVEAALEDEEAGTEKGTDFGNPASIYDSLLRKFLAMEFFEELVIEDGEPERVLIRLEWLAMEYVLIRQICRLRESRGLGLTYKEMRDVMVLTSRMMGYDDEDITSYIENSFESPIWDFGYLALIIGTGTGSRRQ